MNHEPPFKGIKLFIARIIERKYKRDVLSLLEEDRDAKVLDLGCSDGIFTKKIMGRVKPKVVYGVDMNDGNLVEAKRLGIIGYKGDLNDRFPAMRVREFDVVIASQIIEHLPNTDRFVKEIYRALKPEGYAVISTPNMANWHNILYLLLGKQPETASVSDEIDSEYWNGAAHMRLFTLPGLIKLLTFHGFKIDKIAGGRHSAFITVRVRRGRGRCHT